MSTWENEIYSNVVTVFGGVIDRPVAKDMSLAGKHKLHSITCADWHYITDKRIIAKAYQNQTAGYIVRDIITNYLEVEGITEGTVQDGEILTEAVFNYIYISDAFASLAEQAGFEWYIDADKQLHFFARDTFKAPVNVTETSDIKNIEVEPAAEDYRNKQYIRAAKDITDPLTATFNGDGKTKAFTVSYDLAYEPIVKVDTVVQTVGIRGVEEGKQWYWNKGDKVITPDDAATPLTSVQELEIIYQGYFDIVVLSSNQSAIDEMQAIEGGTGIHEDVLDDPYITSRASAFESANAKLNRFAKIGNKVSFDTKLIGLKAGQLINIDLPSFYIDETDFLIESVKASELGTKDGRLIYQVLCVDGAATGGWANFFKKMAARDKSYVIRENIQENEMLVTLSSFTKTWLETDNPNIFKQLYPEETLYPGATLYPSIDNDNRVEYIAFFDSSHVELFRKRIVKQTEDIPGQLVTTTLILPNEANDMPIQYVGWFGGAHATDEANTGTLLDKQTFIRVKTSSESIQIDKTDIKGW